MVDIGLRSMPSVHCRAHKHWCMVIWYYACRFITEGREATSTSLFRWINFSFFDFRNQVCILHWTVKPWNWSKCQDRLMCTSSSYAIPKYQYATMHKLKLNTLWTPREQASVEVGRTWYVLSVWFFLFVYVYIHFLWTFVDLIVWLECRRYW